MQEKYIDLLINKCMELEEHPILFIHFSKEIDKFIQKLVFEVKKMGITDIYLDYYDPYEIHDFLKNSSIEEIETSSYFDSSIWDEYAKKQACFLIFETEYPHLMDDVDSKKIAISSRKRRNTKALYSYMVEHCELSWCIAAYPGECWAKEIFKTPDSYQKLEQAIYKICLLDEEYPLVSWNNHLEETKAIIKYLNQLKLEKLHYSNSLGTNLDIYLPKNYLFSSAEDRQVIVNMPSYEIFTSPLYDKTEGIVYNSRPLYFNGALIDQFWLKFHQGKVIDFDAKIGKEMLKEILTSDEQSCYLGECALVEKSSPIASQNLVFGTTLIDENASCHLALGAGFPECIEEGLKLDEKHLFKEGINVSKTHVDFMIGTDDLSIIGVTKSGKQVPIFTNGNFDCTLRSQAINKL